MWDILPKGNLQYFLQKLKGKLDSKVDAVSGKGLSTNDFTTTEKNKLAGIEAGAQVNPTIDSALSDSSTNAVQNKIVKGALDSKAGREEIPTVNDNTITIQLNGTTIESFTLNQTTDETINIQVTKSSVGLGNVPNVSTNDQTPTFTQASTRTNIASGEKLSVIFGKIMKWFADLKTVAFSGSYTDLSNKPTTDSLLAALPTWTATPTDDTYLLRRDMGGTASYGQVKFSSIWSYINSKVSAAGYTKNAGTVTSVKVGSTSYNPSSGVVSLPSYPTSVNYATSAGTAGKALISGENSGAYISVPAEGTTVIDSSHDSHYYFPSCKAITSYLNSNFPSTGWVTLNSTYPTYYRKQAGIVFVIMRLVGGSTPAADTVLGTLPQGYRPPVQMAMPTHDLKGIFIVNNTDGKVIISAQSGKSLGNYEAAFLAYPL